MNTDRSAVVMVILDGFGLAPDGPGNAVARASTPNFDRLQSTMPSTQLEASGPAVGLPEGQMGNSEVGHLNLGAGRVVQQSLSFVTENLKAEAIDGNEVWLELLRNVRPGGTLHLMGLVSDGGVHSHVDHLLALVDAAARAGVQRVRVHAFTDGRDTSPTSGRGFLREVASHLQGAPIDARIASVSGRYLAMDRDRRWERTQAAFDAVVCGDGQRKAPSADDAMAQAEANGETDEFVTPTVITDDGTPVGPVEDGDAVLFFNFRADRARQLSEALIGGDGFDGFDRCRRPAVAYASLMPYDASWDTPYLLSLPPLKACLAEVLSVHGRTQFHAAETEKYPHVTYFFNAKIEEPFEGESRHIEPSPKVATYDLQPEMSAPALTEAVVTRIRERIDDFVLVNFANPDMVGHTGDIGAAVKACEAVDVSLGKVLEATEETGARLLVLADHGNAETMMTADGQPHTAHTTNQVPFVLAGAGDVTLREGGILGDVAPTVLALLGVPQPEEMTGRSLIGA